ncbi:MAG: TIGR00730 family Rossman fold protein [Pseudomonadota bacterium]
MQQAQISVCVFCGARDGAQDAYRTAAVETGQCLARNDWRLVYGAGDRGIMGAVAQSTREGGGRTLGVIPTHLMGQERLLGTAPDVIVTETMHERKKVMFMNADAVVILPGGAGTLDEFFEGLTWAQIGLHKKPIFIVNTDGYWDSLILLLDQIIAEGFADASLRDYLSIVDDARGLEAGLRARFSAP